MAPESLHASRSMIRSRRFMQSWKVLSDSLLAKWKTLPTRRVRMKTLYFKRDIKTEISVCEESLHLTVYTPQNFQTSKPKPVMVWIHGGGWSEGSAALYNGSPLAIAGTLEIVIN